MRPVLWWVHGDVPSEQHGLLQGASLKLAPFPLCSLTDLEFARVEANHGRDGDEMVDTLLGVVDDVMKAGDVATMLFPRVCLLGSSAAHPQVELNCMPVATRSRTLRRCAGVLRVPSATPLGPGAGLHDADQVQPPPRREASPGNVCVQRARGRLCAEGGGRDPPPQVCIPCGWPTRPVGVRAGGGRR